ncbi:hypothetical protein WMF18_12955 [Sorangium sp. So ce315]|uniref:hypothetical protein n=1 Tax=Sorangium sp. So ce315 TaxID=3133299 RepID=UPI003F6453EE
MNAAFHARVSTTDQTTTSQRPDVEVSDGSQSEAPDGSQPIAELVRLRWPGIVGVESRHRTTAMRQVSRPKMAMVKAGSG